MPRTSFDDVNSLVDPLLTYNFDLIFPFIPGVGGLFARGLTVRCYSTTLPGMQIDQVTVPLHGVEVSYAGRQIWTKTFDCTFNEMRDLAVRQAIRGWIEFARNNRENRGNYKGQGTNGYAVTAIMQLYDDIPNVIQTTQIFGCFPINLGDLALDGSASTAAQYTVTFSFDKTEEVFGVSAIL